MRFLGVGKTCDLGALSIACSPRGTRFASRLGISQRLMGGDWDRFQRLPDLF